MRGLYSFKAKIQKVDTCLCVMHICNNTWMNGEAVMTKLSDEDLLKKIDSCMEELAGSEEKAEAFFCEAGIYNPDGSLTEAYKTD